MQKRMKHTIQMGLIWWMGLAGFTGGLMSCSQTGVDMATESATENGTEREKVMHFDMLHPAMQEQQMKNDGMNTRVTETGFEDKDVIGMYICHAGSQLQLTGNYVTNERLQYNGTQWTSRNPLYWNEGTYDIYAYYPYTSEVTSTEEMTWLVAEKTMAEADLLWASALEMKASKDPVKLAFKHCLSKLTVQLVKGQDYGNQPLPENAEVWIHHTVAEAKVNLATGKAVRASHGRVTSIQAQAVGNQRYAAIVVPQEVPLVPLVEVVVNEVSYIVEQSIVFKQGMHHRMTVILNRNPDKVKVEIGGEVNQWEDIKSEKTVYRKTVYKKRQ